MYIYDPLLIQNLLLSCLTFEANSFFALALLKGANWLGWLSLGVYLRFSHSQVESALLAENYTSGGLSMSVLCINSYILLICPLAGVVTCWRYILFF